MCKGIIIFGAPGVGDTTLGKEVAKQLGIEHLDMDDYNWLWNTEIPYTIMRSNKQRIKCLMNDILKYRKFVLSGSMWSIRKEFEAMFDMAVFVTAPAEIRAERIRKRELEKWGDRVLPGGDIYNVNKLHRDYLAEANSYETDKSPQLCLEQHKLWAEELKCPVLHVDGTKNIAENTEFVVCEFLDL